MGGGQNINQASSRRDFARVEDTQGTPTQSHISPRILWYTKINQEVHRLAAAVDVRASAYITQSIHQKVLESQHPHKIVNLTFSITN